MLVNAHYETISESSAERYPGAYDNASGVAVVMETARRLSTRAAELGRSISSASSTSRNPHTSLATDMGSVRFVDQPPVPIDRIDLMVNLDLVGNRIGPGMLREDLPETIFVHGAATGSGLAELVESTGTGVPGISRLSVAEIGVPILSEPSR